MKNLLVVGSSGYFGTSFIDKTRKDFRFIGLDKVKYKGVENKLYREFTIDVTKIEELAKVKKSLENENIKIDGILFSMGINPLKSFYDINEQKWDETFSVNLKSIVFIIKAMYSVFEDKVSLVLIGSQNGVVGHESRIDYGPSKAALIQLAKNLTLDFEQDKTKDIKVNVVSPSYILNDSNREYLLNSSDGKKLLKKIPLKKFVELEDVVGTVDFLFSSESRAIRGQNIVVDYGYTIA